MRRCQRHDCIVPTIVLICHAAKIRNQFALSS
jgi:hypothetical protein